MLTCKSSYTGRVVRAKDMKRMSTGVIIGEPTYNGVVVLKTYNDLLIGLCDNEGNPTTLTWSSQPDFEVGLQDFELIPVAKDN